MAAMFVASVRSEWLKTRRSLTTWVVVGAACFVPAIVLLIRLTRPASLPALYRTTDFWMRLWISLWESMSLMVLPLTIIVLVSLVTQIEYRNNTWKQLHASPQPLGRIFFAKLAVIVALVVELFVCFNVAIYLLAMLPAWIRGDVDAPTAPIPVRYFLWRNVSFFLDALPVVVLQYLLALRFRSFVIPLGAGLALWIAALGGLPWEFNYVIPYSYPAIDYTLDVPSRVSHQLPASTRWLATAWFVALTAAGYGLYVTRRDRG